MAMTVSDTNENEVYTGVLNIWKTTDSGTTFTDSSPVPLTVSVNNTTTTTSQKKLQDLTMLIGMDL